MRLVLPIGKHAEMWWHRTVRTGKEDYFRWVAQECWEVSGAGQVKHLTNGHEGQNLDPLNPQKTQAGTMAASNTKTRSWDK